MARKQLIGVLIATLPFVFYPASPSVAHSGTNVRCRILSASANQSSFDGRMKLINRSSSKLVITGTVVVHRANHSKVGDGSSIRQTPVRPQDDAISGYGGSIWARGADHLHVTHCHAMEWPY